MNFLKNLMQEVGKTGQFILLFLLAIFLPGVIIGTGSEILPQRFSALLLLLGAATFLICMIAAFYIFFRKPAHLKDRKKRLAELKEAQRKASEF